MRVFHDSRCLDHRAPAGFPERPERLTELLRALADDARFELVEGSGVASDSAALEAVRTVHDPEYVARLLRAVERGDGLFDSADNPLSPGTFDAALAAVACGLAALDHVLSVGEPAFAAVRPPGHHAERGRAMGFCYFDTVAVVADTAIRRGDAGRVAIVDFDVHHGNGTQHLFEERGDVFYASLHQYPFYPGSGAEGERGRGAGLGATLNLPLAAGGGDREWLDALDRGALPALRRFAPDLLLISAGFDAWRNDPLGGMQVSAEGFHAIGERLFTLAGETSAGRAVALLEGGYDVAALPSLVTVFLEPGVNAPGA